MTQVFGLNSKGNNNEEDGLKKPQGCVLLLHTTKGQQKNKTACVNKNVSMSYSVCIMSQK